MEWQSFLFCSHTTIMLFVTFTIKFNFVLSFCVFELYLDANKSVCNSLTFKFLKWHIKFSNFIRLDTVTGWKVCGLHTFKSNSSNFKRNTYKLFYNIKFLLFFFSQYQMSSGLQGPIFLLFVGNMRAMTSVCVRCSSSC